MKYTVVASRNGKVFRTFGPMSKPEAVSFRRKLLREEREHPYAGVLSLSVVQCWPVVNGVSAPEES